jgi:hypothetical protein
MFAIDTVIHVCNDTGRQEIGRRDDHTEARTMRKMLKTLSPMLGLVGIAKADTTDKRRWTWKTVLFWYIGLKVISAVGHMTAAAMAAGH